MKVIIEYEIKKKKNYTKIEIWLDKKSKLCIYLIHEFKYQEKKKQSVQNTFLHCKKYFLNYNYTENQYFEPTQH